MVYRGLTYLLLFAFLATQSTPLHGWRPSFYQKKLSPRTLFSAKDQAQKLLDRLEENFETGYRNYRALFEN